MSNDAWSWLSLADMESMVLNMGVVSALMLSFCVGVFSTVPAEETAFGDYRFAMLGLPAFRTFAVEVLETEGFNFNHPVPGRAVPLDIRSALTKATDFDVIESTLHPPANGYCVFNGPFSACTQDVKDIADAIVLTCASGCPRAPPWDIGIGPSERPIELLGDLDADATRDTAFHLGVHAHRSYRIADSREPRTFWA